MQTAIIVELLSKVPDRCQRAIALELEELVCRSLKVDRCCLICYGDVIMIESNDKWLRLLFAHRSCFPASFR